jgi:hypothetical protein
VATCSSLRIRPMTVEAVPRTARMIITRISQEGMDPNKFRTRIVASSRLGAAKVGNACVAIRWVTRWSESQYLVSIVFKDSPPLSCSVSRARHNRGRLRIRPAKIKRAPLLCGRSLMPPPLVTYSNGCQPSPHRHA